MNFEHVADTEWGIPLYECPVCWAVKKNILKHIIKMGSLKGKHKDWLKKNDTKTHHPYIPPR